MMGTPTPTSATTTAVTSKKEKTNEKQRSFKVKKKKKCRYQQASKVFEELSQDGYSIDEFQLVEFLSKVLQIDKSQLDEHAIQLIKDTTVVESAKLNVSVVVEPTLEEQPLPKQKQHQSFQFTRKQMLEVLDTYDTYVEDSKKINEIFDKYDSDMDGYLTKFQLKEALQDHERRYARTRYVNGVPVTLFVEDEDITEIMDDSNPKGRRINRSTLLPAIAAWESIAQRKIEQKQTSHHMLCCIVM